MPEILNIVDAHPLEREYEAWVIRCIEEYLMALGRHYRVYACDIALERAIGADEKLDLDSKIIGIQFKRALLSPVRQNQQQIDFSNLFWRLTDQGNQFTTIRNNNFVAYGLPTFINRNYRFNALHHCLFFKPRKKEATPGDYWYCHTPPQDLQHNLNFCRSSWRWGEFWEIINSCDFGTRDSSKKVISNLMEEFKTSKLEGKDPEPIYLFEISGFPQ